jgi:hypothetical protein
MEAMPMPSTPSEPENEDLEPGEPEESEDEAVGSGSGLLDLTELNGGGSGSGLLTFSREGDDTGLEEEPYLQQERLESESSKNDPLVIIQVDGVSADTNEEWAENFVGELKKATALVEELGITPREVIVFLNSVIIEPSPKAIRISSQVYLSVTDFTLRKLEGILVTSGRISNPDTLVVSTARRVGSRCIWSPSS